MKADTASDTAQLCFFASFCKPVGEHVAQQPCWPKHEAQNDGVRCEHLLFQTVQVDMPACNNKHIFGKQIRAR